MEIMLIPYNSEYEINETVKSLKNSTAGWDFIPVSIAKHNMLLIIILNN